MANGIIIALQIMRTILSIKIFIMKQKAIYHRLDGKILIVVSHLPVMGISGRIITMVEEGHSLKIKSRKHPIALVYILKLVEATEIYM